MREQSTHTVIASLTELIGNVKTQETVIVQHWEIIQALGLRTSCKNARPLIHENSPIQRGEFDLQRSEFKDSVDKYQFET